MTKIYVATFIGIVVVAALFVGAFQVAIRVLEWIYCNEYSIKQFADDIVEVIYMIFDDDSYKTEE